MATEHDRACWGVLRRTKGDAAFPEVIPLCATRVVVGRRPEHYEAPDTVFRTASAHDDALPDVASTQIDRVALEASKRLSKVHCIFQRTEDTNAVVEVHTNNGFAVNQAPVGKGTRAALRDGDGVQLLGDGPGQPGVLYNLALRGAPTWRAGAVFYDEAVVAALRGETRARDLKAREVATRLGRTTWSCCTDTRPLDQRRGGTRAGSSSTASRRRAGRRRVEGGRRRRGPRGAAVAPSVPSSLRGLRPRPNPTLDAVLPTPTPAARPEPHALEPPTRRSRRRGLVPERRRRGRGPRASPDAGRPSRRSRRPSAEGVRPLAGAVAGSPAARQRRSGRRRTRGAPRRSEAEEEARAEARGEPTRKARADRTRGRAEGGARQQRTRRGAPRRSDALTRKRGLSQAQRDEAVERRRPRGGGGKVRRSQERKDHSLR